MGIRYLLSVSNVSDLILNSLALTFLVTVDEMISGLIRREFCYALSLCIITLRNCQIVNGLSPQTQLRIFEAFATEQDVAVIRQCHPILGQSIRCVDKVSRVSLARFFHVKNIAIHGNVKCLVSCRYLER